MSKTYFIYIIVNQKNTVLYVGMTSNLTKRIGEHKSKRYGCRSFSGRYNIDKLVYYETYSKPMLAINREKQLKKWSRIKKNRLRFVFKYL